MDKKTAPLSFGLARLPALASLLALGLATLACNYILRPQARGPATPTPAPIPQHCTNSAGPTQADIDYALAYPGKTFAASDWEQTYNTENQRVSVAWTSQNDGALAYLEYLPYDCGYTQADLDEFFSPENIAGVILQNYQNPQPLAQCRQDAEKLTLYEYRTSLHDTSYLVRLWVRPVSNTRVLYFLLTFPEESRSTLDKYAQTMFPALTSCP